MNRIRLEETRSYHFTRRLHLGGTDVMYERVGELLEEIDRLRSLLSECEKNLCWPEERHLDLHERVRAALKDTTDHPCPQCQGTGKIDGKPCVVCY